jgi:aspartate-semialdehyde dehydrogenase
MSNKTVAVYGVNGIVGQLMLKELARMPFKVDIIQIGRNDASQPADVAILCTDDAVSVELLPNVRPISKFIVDMSAKFRMEKDVPLVIPEINAHAITKDTQLISSPNCTTTGLVMALNALKNDYTLEEAFFCSYQAISGGGKKLLEEYRIHGSEYQENCVPLIGSLQPNGFTSEEMKGINETRKILELPKIKIFPHTVRVAVEVSHSLGATVRAKEEFDLEKVAVLFKKHSGVVYDGNIYTPKEVAGKDAVYISRLRLDPEDKNIIHMWITFDNLLKGAALNGRQIAQLLLEKFI